MEAVCRIPVGSFQPVFPLLKTARSRHVITVTNIDPAERKPGHKVNRTRAALRLYLLTA